MNRVNLDWRSTSQDLDNYDQFKSMLTHGMKASGFWINEVGHETDDSGWSYTLTAGRHHSGTTRMHEDPKKGVVDPNCKVHGTKKTCMSLGVRCSQPPGAQIQP